MFVGDVVIGAPRVTLHDNGDSYSVRWKSTSFRVNKSHYDKLTLLFRRLVVHSLPSLPIQKSCDISS